MLLFILPKYNNIYIYIVLEYKWVGKSENEEGLVSNKSCLCNSYLLGRKGKEKGGDQFRSRSKTPQF